VGHAAITRVGGREDPVLPLRVVERIVEARNHPRGVTKGRVNGDVLHPLAVNEDLTAVAQRLDELVAGHRRGVLDARGRFRASRHFQLVVCNRDLIVAYGDFHEHSTFDMRTTVRRANES